MPAAFAKGVNGVTGLAGLAGLAELAGLVELAALVELVGGGGAGSGRGAEEEEDGMQDGMDCVAVDAVDAAGVEVALLLYLFSDVKNSSSEELERFGSCMSRESTPRFKYALLPQV